LDDIASHICKEREIPMDKLDFKKQDKILYAPGSKPSIIMVPPMNFIMVDGHGNPNDPGGEYNKAIELLFPLTFTIKMGIKFGKIKLKEKDELIDYMVPPLEGLWWLADVNDINFTRKNNYCWTSMIRQPDFITPEVFEQAQAELRKKKPELDVTKARLEVFEEGLCVQCMHTGPFDTEPVTIEKIDEFIRLNGLTYDIGTVLPDGHTRQHHEIYMGDPRKANPAKFKTILRHPVRK
jgi:hypothetical protein